MPRLRRRPPLTPERRDLAAGYFRRAMWHAQRAAARRPQMDRDELVSAAGMACVTAAADFDPALGAWPPFARRRVLWALRDASLAAARRRRARVAFDADAGEDAPGRSEGLGALESPFGRLTPRQRDALELAVIGGATYADAARSMGVDPRSVAALVTRGLDGLRAALPAAG